MKIKTHWNAFGQNEVLEMHLAPFLDQLSELEQKSYQGGPFKGWENVGSGLIDLLNFELEQ